jgi:hypothetical protein
MTSQKCAQLSGRTGSQTSTAETGKLMTTFEIEAGLIKRWGGYKEKHASS